MVYCDFGLVTKVEYKMWNVQRLKLTVLGGLDCKREVSLEEARLDIRLVFK